MRKSGLILCKKHRTEQGKINIKKAQKKYMLAQYILKKELTSEQKRQITKDVLCRYFSDLKEREQDLVPICAECESQDEVVSVINQEGLKLLCLECRAKIYRRPERKHLRLDFGVKCDWCEAWGARKVTNNDFYLCPIHYGEYQEQLKRRKTS